VVCKVRRCQAATGADCNAGAQRLVPLSYGFTLLGVGRRAAHLRRKLHPLRTRSRARLGDFDAWPTREREDRDDKR
jgi:hypothetical protein